MSAAIRLVLVGAFAAAAVSCGDVVRDGRSPVFLVLESLTASRGAVKPGPGSSFLLSDVVTLITEPLPCAPTSPCQTIFNDTGSATFRLSLKDISSGTAPSSNNVVTLFRYRVDFRRSDGRNTPGVDVPYGFDGGVSGTVPATGTAAVGFELVRHVAKQESPLVQLGSSPVIISTIAEITFYGRDQVGNDISVTGSITVDFGNFGDQ